MTLDFLIPTKNRGDGPGDGRGSSLGRTLASVVPAARRGGAGIIICDQSPRPWPDGAGVRVLHRPDLNGLPAARNVLLAASTAELVCFLDDDVDVGGDLGERLLACAGAEPDIVGWGPVVEVRPPAVQRLHRLGQLGSLRDPRRLLARRCDRPTTALFGCCFAVRREAALRTGFDARRGGYALGEDLDFFLRLAAPLRFVADLRCVHRRDGGDRLDPAVRGRRKAELVWWLARRHGGGNPATLLHALVALAAAAGGGGHEPAAALGVARGTIAALAKA